MDRAGMPKILVALDPQDTQIAYDVLEGEFDFTLCHTFQEAEALLHDEIVSAFFSPPSPAES